MILVLLQLIASLIKKIIIHTPMNHLTFIYPDDWHCHFRDGDYLSRTVADSANQFARAIVMPNLETPITTVKNARAYRQRIIHQIPNHTDFNPLMTLYLTENMHADTIREAKGIDFIVACKLYPAGATTLSDKGVRDLNKIYPILEIMQQEDLILLIHGESIDPKIDIFDREAVFIEQHLIPLLKHFPKLRVVLEHISTKTAVEFVKDGPENLAATITAHHLLFNRNAIFKGGIRPHYYCLPIFKRNEDQQALIQAATSGHAKFFLGTDSAPHPQDQKESHCGCAGIYTAHAAMSFYAHVFEQQNALSQLEKFASINGAQFYQLPLNTKKIKLIKKPWQVPSTLSFGSQQLIPLLAGETLDWQIKK